MRTSEGHGVCYRQAAGCKLWGKPLAPLLQQSANLRRLVYGLQICRCWRGCSQLTQVELLQSRQEGLAAVPQTDFSSSWLPQLQIAASA